MGRCGSLWVLFLKNGAFGFQERTAGRLTGVGVVGSRVQVCSRVLDRVSIVGFFKVTFVESPSDLLQA